MSVWTHVNASIRIDGLPSEGDDIASIDVGKQALWEASREDWEACDIPCGSEGSLQHRVLEYSDGLTWVLVSVWGDPRNYEEEHDGEIVQYLSRITKGHQVRSGVAEIHTGGCSVKIARYCRETEAWIIRTEHSSAK